MKKIFAFAALCAAVLVSCTQKEIAVDTPVEEQSDVKLIPITITANFEGVKSDMVDAAWTWKSGDKLAVYDGTGKCEFTLDDSSADTDVAKFTGKVAENFTELKAVFPFEKAGDSFGTPTIPAEQAVAADGTIDPMAMIATSDRAEKVSDDEYNFYFTNGVSLLRFTPPAGATKVILHAAAKGETLAGDSPSVTVDLGTAADGTKRFWAAVNPAKLSGIHVFTLKNDGKYYRLGTEKEIDLSTPGKGKNLGSLAAGMEVAVIENGDQLVSYLGSTPTLDAYIVKDLDLSGNTVSSCASYGKTFDGLWHSIGNWTASNALFTTNAGTIQNLVIDNTCKINWTAAIPDQTGVSFIVAKTHTGTVTDCEVAGSITVETDDAGRIFCAGIVGESTTGTVKNCVFRGKIDVIFTSTTQSCSAVAGIVARAGKANSTNGKVIISGCKNYGSISFTFSGPAANLNKIAVGGILGQTVSVANADKDYGIIEKCENRGTVTFEAINGGNSKSNATLGGVAGIIEGSIRECNNYSSVTFKGSKDKATNNVSIGGVAGYVTLGATDCHNYGELVLDSAFAGGTAMSQSGGNTSCSAFGGVFGCAGAYASGEILGDDFTAPTTEVLVENCSNKVALSFQPKMVTTGGPKFLLGGVVGASTATLKDCFNTGDITIVSQPRFILAGGIAGLATADINNCDNSGALSVDADKVNHPSGVGKQQHYIGGIAGYVLESITIKDCENSKAISLSNVYSTPSSLSYLGGIIGSYSGALTMDNCQNSGDITNNADTPICVGGVAGAFNGSMQNNTKNSGTVKNTSSYTASGKESEIGGLIGYVNASITGCQNTGAVINVDEHGFAGGLCGGNGKTNRTWSNCTVSCEVSGAATKGAVLGRFRNSGTTVQTLGATDKPVTISGSCSSLPLCGELNGNTITETNVVIE